MRRLLLFLVLSLGTAGALIAWMEDGNLYQTLGWQNPNSDSDVRVEPKRG
jgi:hypothetical protein